MRHSAKWSSLKTVLVVVLCCGLFLKGCHEMQLRWSGPICGDEDAGKGPHRVVVKDGDEGTFICIKLDAPAPAGFSDPDGGELRFNADPRWARVSDLWHEKNLDHSGNPRPTATQSGAKTMLPTSP